MGYRVSTSQMDAIIKELSKVYRVYAPKRFVGQGRYSDTDIIRYDEVFSEDEIVFDVKSEFPAKEVISPIQQAIFYFTEDEYRASKGNIRPMLIFARPCDINAQKIQAKIYAGNGNFVDMYYERARELVKFVLMDCCGGDDTCFCTSMGTNKTDDYVFAVKKDGDNVSVEVKDGAFDAYFADMPASTFKPEFVESNSISVTVPEIPDRETLNKLKAHDMWKEFNSRCISCGACTMACSTCTCFTTRDIYYGENCEAGERHRISASCQVDGFSDMAGGHTYRTTPGDRMRYKMLHKFHDYKARFGDQHMCVGCGRCTKRCPEFISISVTLKKMSKALEDICNDQVK